MSQLDKNIPQKIYIEIGVLFGALNVRFLFIFFVHL